jgi:hypothetical protein
MLDVNIQIRGINRLWFDKRELKAAIRKGGREVQKEARRLISRRAVSGAGELPGMDSGEMRRQVKVKVGSGGMYAVVSPHKSAAMGDYYPAFLIYGTKRGIEKRKDFIQEAFANKQSAVRSVIRRSLARAIRTASR